MMKYKILTDSGCDLPEKKIKAFDIIPMSLNVDGKFYKDTIDLKKQKFYSLLENARSFPGSAAPSPYDYIEKISESDKNIFIMTISSALSSSYNNACLSRKQFIERISEKTGKFIHVFDSLNASIGQGLILLKLKELIDSKLTRGEIIVSLNKYIQETNSFFVLEKMDNLINSGRINKVLGKIASTLNIKLILKKTEHGEIALYDKVRGAKKTFNRLLDIIGQNGRNLEDKILGIAHYNCLEKAEYFKEKAKEIYPFKDIIITNMGPTIATYAAEGALLISF